MITLFKLRNVRVKTDELTEVFIFPGVNNAQESLDTVFPMVRKRYSICCLFGA